MVAFRMAHVRETATTSWLAHTAKGGPAALIRMGLAYSVDPRSRSGAGDGGRCASRRCDCRRASISLVLTAPSPHVHRPANVGIVVATRAIVLLDSIGWQRKSSGVWIWRRRVWRTSHTLVLTTPLLLVLGPSPLPIGITRPAIPWDARGRLWTPRTNV